MTNMHNFEIFFVLFVMQKEEKHITSVLKYEKYSKTFDNNKAYKPYECCIISGAIHSLPNNELFF